MEAQQRRTQRNNQQGKQRRNRQEIEQELYHDDLIHNVGVGVAELLDTIVRGYRFTQMTSTNATTIKNLANANAATSMVVILTKLLCHTSQRFSTDGNRIITNGVLSSIKNIWDILTSMEVANSAKKIAANNAQKSEKQKNKEQEIHEGLLRLLALEQGASITSKATFLAVPIVRNNYALGTFNQLYPDFFWLARRIVEQAALGILLAGPSTDDDENNEVENDNYDD